MDEVKPSAQTSASGDADVPTVIISETYLPRTQDSLKLLQEVLKGFGFKRICENPEYGWLITFSNNQRGAKHCRRVFKHVSNRGWQPRISEVGPYMRSNHGSVMDVDTSTSSWVSEQNGDFNKRRRLMSSEHETPAPTMTSPLRGYSSSIVGGTQPRYAISKPKVPVSGNDKKIKTPSTSQNAKGTATPASEPTAAQASTERVQSAILQSSDNLMTRPATPMALLLREIMMESGAPQSWTSQLLVEKIRERHPYYAEVFPQKTLKSNVPSYLSQSPYFQRSGGSVKGHPFAYLWELAPKGSTQKTHHDTKSARVSGRDVQALQDPESSDMERVDETYYVKSSFTAQFEICTRRAHVKAWNDLEVLEETCHAGTIYKPGETARILIDDDEEDGDYAHIFALRKTEKLGVAAAVLWYKSKSDPAVKRTPGAQRELTNEQGQHLLTSHVDIVSVETFAGLASREEKARLSTTKVIDMKPRPWRIRASDEPQVSWMRQYVAPQQSLDEIRTADTWQDRRASITSMEDTTLLGAGDGDGTTGDTAGANKHVEALQEENHALLSEVTRLRTEADEKQAFLEQLQNKVNQLHTDVKHLQRGSQGMMQLEYRVEAQETEMKELRALLLRAGHAQQVGGRAGQVAEWSSDGLEQ